MGIVIKPDKDVDLYVDWSNIVEDVLFVGSRAEIISYLYDSSEFKHDRHPTDSVPETRVARADEYGSSSRIGDGCWDDKGKIVQQKGWLPRTKLLEYCRLALVSPDAGFALLEPFDD